jgi:hypothetical protein
MVIGNGLSEWFDTGANHFLGGVGAWVWPVVFTVGGLGSAVLGIRAGRGQRDWRYAAILPIFLVFIAATYRLFPPKSGYQMDAFPSLVVGTVYMLAGLWRGLRLSVVGAFVVALTLFGYLTLTAHYYLWMAVVYGGGLILAGLWFRRA